MSGPRCSVGSSLRSLSAWCVDATVKALIKRTDGKRLQVDFGKDEIALIHLWQVVDCIR